jgi:hypothetical protein
MLRERLGAPDAPALLAALDAAARVAERAPLAQAGMARKKRACAAREQRAKMRCVERSSRSLLAAAAAAAAV